MCIRDRISSASILTDDFLLAACAQYEADQRSRRTSALHDDFLLDAWCKYDADQRYRLSEPSAAGKFSRLVTCANDSAPASSPSGDLLLAACSTYEAERRMQLEGKSLANSSACGSRKRKESECLYVESGRPAATAAVPVRRVSSSSVSVAAACFVDIDFAEETLERDLDSFIAAGVAEEALALKHG